MKKLIVYLPDYLYEKMKTEADQDHIPLSVLTRMLITGKMKLAEEDSSYNSKEDEKKQAKEMKELEREQAQRVRMERQGTKEDPHAAYAQKIDATYKALALNASAEQELFNEYWKLSHGDLDNTRFQAWAIEKLREN